ncbi:MAG TPA: PDZ domain-containing protein [Gemmatimonadales bacterium]|jgi:S1-C subfamily serine protease|nr:PDZ domain-containing protein [Gemmatimonadales bacterium]
MNRKLLLLCTTCVLPGVLSAQEQPKPRRAEPRPGVMTYSFSGNHARIGVVVSRGADADSDKIGARIAAVTPGGPAAKAGIKAGDVITKFNGVSLANVRSEDSDESGPGNKLIELAQALDPGDTVQVEYKRGSDAKKATIVVEDVTYSVNGNSNNVFGDRGFSLAIPKVEMTPFPDMRMPSPLMQGWGSGEGFGMELCFGDAWCNLELVSLNSDLGDYFGTRDGVLVVKASEDSLLPLKSGDVIVSIGDRKPTSPAQAMRILRSYDSGETVNVEIMRHQKRQTISWKVPSPEDRERGRMRRDSKRRTEEGAMRERMMRPMLARAHNSLVVI